MNMIRRKLPSLSSRNAFLIGIICLVLGVLMQAYAVLFEVVPDHNEAWYPIMVLTLCWCAIFLPFGYVMRSDDSGTRIGWFLLLVGLLMMPSALILHFQSSSESVSRLTTYIALDAMFIALAGFFIFVYQRSQRMQLERQSVSTIT